MKSGDYYDISLSSKVCNLHSLPSVCHALNINSKVYLLETSTYTLLTVT